MNQHNRLERNGLADITFHRRESHGFRLTSEKQVFLEA
jgi:hypothetical protein